MLPSAAVATAAIVAKPSGYEAGVVDSDVADGAVDPSTVVAESAGDSANGSAGDPADEDAHADTANIVTTIHRTTGTLRRIGHRVGSRHDL